MKTDFEKFADMAMKAFTEEEKVVMGVGNKKASIDEDAGFISRVANFNDLLLEGVDLKPVNAIDSGDGELVFMFEDEEDAGNLYSFMTENGLLHAGEITISESDLGMEVSFTRSVMENKPELIQAALLAYEGKLSFDEEDDTYQFESVIEDIGNYLSEVTVSGAGKTSMKGNPFHDKKTGLFVNPTRHIKAKGGSWSDGRRKLKFLGAGKDKKKQAMAKYGSTKHPCGRAARRMGKNIRCWDGAVLTPAQQMAKMLKGMKVREGFDMMDKALLMEMRAKYRKLSF
jgi:hypothetical protein